MIQKVSMVYFAGSADDFRRLQDSLFSCCSSVSKSAFWLEPYAVENSYYKDLQNLITSCVCPTAQHDRLELTFVLDTLSKRPIPELAHMIDSARRATEDAKSFGVLNVQTNLIWIMDAGANNQIAAEVLLQDAPIVFSRKLLIGNQKDDLTTVGHDACLNSLAATLRMFVESNPPLDSGVYCLGYHRLQCDLQEMKTYAKHVLAEQIRDGQAQHTPAYELEKRKNPDWLRKIQDQLAAYGGSAFYFVPGLGAETILPPMPDAETLRQEIMDPWEREVLRAAQSTLYPEDYIHLFGGDSWKEFLDSLRMGTRSVGKPVKVPLMGEKKELANAYNRHLQTCNQRDAELRQLLLTCWREKAKELLKKLPPLAEDRNIRLGHYLTGLDTVRRCEGAYLSQAQRIKEYLADHPHDGEDACYLGEAADPEAWDRFFEQEIDQIGITENSIRADLNALPPNALAALIKQELNPKAHRVFARSNAFPFDENGFQRYLFMTQAMQEPLFAPADPDASIVPSGRCFRSDNPAYGNLEKLILTKVDNDRESPFYYQKTLTMFLRREEAMEPDEPEQPASTPPEKMTRIFQRSPQAVGAQSPAEQPAADKPTLTYQSGDQKVSIGWPKSLGDSLKLVIERLEVRGDGKRSFIRYREIDLDRNKVMTSGGSYKPEIDNGVFRLALEKQGRRLAECEMTSRKRLHLSDHTETVPMGETVFIKHVLVMNNDDAEPGMETCLHLVLPDGKTRQLRGKAKKHETTWEVYSTDSQITLTADGHSQDWYDIVL